MMKPTVLSALPLMASLASAAPLVARQDTNIDATVLQFALTLEHLENKFYNGALEKFSEKDFNDAGYSSDYYHNLQYIGHDEAEHVKLLSGALTAAGVTPVAECEYTFPYTDIPSFITLSSVLEGVGTSAYLGGAPLITSKAYLTVAGSILVTEAKHTSYQRAAVGEIAIANPYGTPLDPTSVYTLAAAFIKSCPSTNAALPFKPFPSLAVTPAKAKRNLGVNLSLGGHKWGKKEGEPYLSEPTEPTLPCAGSTVSFTAESDIPKGSYVTFVNGLGVSSVKGKIQGKTISAEIPKTVEGQAYVFVSSKDVETTFDDSAVVFGPAILEVKPQPPTLF
jgi:hypothetical protein